jgi:hypothetical protein
MSDPREDLIAAKAEIALLRTLLESVESALAHERAIWCDKPEDRLYHAEDQTWWERDEEGEPHRAEPPLGVSQVAMALLRFTREGVNDEAAYEAALRLIERRRRR